jgi:glycosyltransferase involved in cell wall biosynthesis
VIVGFDATTLVGRISGVGYYTTRLMESLARAAGRSALERLVVLSNREVQAPPGPRVEVWETGRFGVRSVWLQLVLPRLLRLLRPDLVHYTNYLAPLKTDVPYVVSIHDMSLTLFPRFHTLKKRLLTSTLVPVVARRARSILTPSESSRRDVIRFLGIDPARVTVVPYAPACPVTSVEDALPRLAEQYGVRVPYFLYVGTLEPRKNLLRVLRAFASVAPSLPDHRFLIVGQKGWKYAAILREAARGVLAERVSFLGYVPEADLPALYRHATAFVYPSLYEGFGLPVLEAMACGTPVLTSDRSSLLEVASGAGLLVDPEDEEAIVDGLRRLAGDEALRQDLRARGLARASTYSWERTARETLAVYEQALA